MSSSSYPINLTRSIIVNAPSEKVWTTLKAFGGNEKFNPMVTSSKVEGYGVGSKRVCYVTMDGGKTVLKTIEILNSLNEEDRTMEYRVIYARNTPFVGLVNKVRVKSETPSNRKCFVEFTGSLEVKDEKSKTEIEQILQDTYTGILVGLKKMHESD